MADLVVRIDATTAQFDRALASADKSLLRYSSQLKVAQKAQADFDAAVAASGASSAEAAAAQQRLGAALARTTVAEQKAAIEAKRAGEIQAASARQAAAAQEAASAKQIAATERAAAAQAAALKKVGSIAGGIGLAIGAGFAIAAKQAADFNAKIAQVRSLLGDTASATQIKQLQAAAHGFTEIGASASDAADAEIELVKAGIGVKDILGGALAGALNLAAAGQIDFGTATSIAAAAMTEFQLQGKDIPHVADLLAAGADRALGSVQDLGEGMTYVGLGAHQLGISIDDTVAALAEFANAGLIGSQGGTTLQQVLRQLTGPTNSAALEIKELGLNLYNAQGNFVGLASVAGQLQDKLGNLSQADRDAALNTLFTSRAVRGATILYQDGAAGVEKWQRTVEQSGFAAEQARGKMDSLSGDLQKLGAVIQNDLIDVGQQLQPVLRTITKDLTAVGEFIGNLPDPVKSVGVEVGVMVAALGLGFYAFTRLKGAAISLAETLGVLSGAQVRVGTTAATMAAEETAAAGAMTRGAGVGGVAGRFSKGGALAAGGGIAALIGAGILGQQGGALGSIGSVTLNVASIPLLIPGAAIAALPAGALAAIFAGAKYAGDHPGPKFTAPTNPFTQPRFGGSFTNPQITAPSPGLLALEQHPFQVSTAQSQKVLDQLGVTGEQTFADIAAGARNAADGVGETAGSFSSLEKAASKAWKAMLTGQQSFLSKRSDFRSYQQAIDDANAALKQNGKTLDQNTQKGRDNAASLDSLASTASAYAQTIKDPILQLKFMQQSRHELEQTAESFGMSKQAAWAYTNQALAIPKEVRTEAQFEKNAAYNDIKTYEKAIDSVPGFKNTVVTAHTEQAEAALARLVGLLGVIHSKSVFINVNTAYTHSGVQAPYADGGLVRGPGTATSDSIAARLSDGEFVMREAAVRRYGVGLMRDMNAMRLADGGMVGERWRNVRSGQTIVMSDPNVVGRLAAIEARLSKPLHVHTDNAAEVGGYALLGAHQVVRANTNLQENVAMAQATR